MVAFADVNLSEEQIRGNHNPGAGGWPTIRYFNKGTGYEGEAYPKKTDKAMCDELGDEAMMEAYVEEQGGVSACDAYDLENSACTPKEEKYATKWVSSKTAEQVAAQLTRLEGMTGGKMKPELMKWIKQRIGILKQIVSHGEEAATHEEL